jgi:RNA-directed DNA polymerase
MEDRARQALVKLALEPEWEAQFEPNSYGFRPARSCHDAIEAIYRQVRLVPKWVLDADIAGCFDHIDHDALLRKLGTFPKLRRVIRAWLQAGVLDEGQIAPTSAGTPQGGVISPLLANIALHGLETALRDAFPKNQRLPKEDRYVPGQPAVIRYADDFVVLHRDRETIERAYEVVAEWLASVGLEMKPSKTRIVHTLEVRDGDVGFDFLGFHIRQYPRGRSSSVRMPRTGAPVGFTPSIRPSKESQKRLLRRIREIIRSHKAVSQVRLIRLLNPVIRGWGNYYSKVVSKDIFRRLDALIFEKLKAWAYYRHPNKGRRWIMAKYWSFSADRWVFGIRDRIKLISLSDLPIQRHTCLRKGKSPFDGDWVYWSQRLGQYPDVPKSVAIRLRMQDGACSHCGLFFRPEDDMVIVHLDGDRRHFRRDNMALVHQRCVAAVKK